MVIVNCTVDVLDARATLARSCFLASSCAADAATSSHYDFLEVFPDPVRSLAGYSGAIKSTMTRLASVQRLLLLCQQAFDVNLRMGDGADRLIESAR